MYVIKTAIDLMRRYSICDNCLGRVFANLLTGYSNKERGRFVKSVVAMLIDCGEKIEIDPSNIRDIKLRNLKVEAEKKKCYFCGDFFENKIEFLAKKIVEKLKEYDFSTFLIGTKLSGELKLKEEEMLDLINPEFYESIKSEINREIGKKVEAMTNKRMNREAPEVIVLVDLEKEVVSLNVKSLFIVGEYKKFVRNLPQATWYCQSCKGKGCENCKGTGLLYKSSVQMIIEKPILKVTKGKKSKIHAAGREDIDVRCLGWRPFVIEIVKPKVRKVELKKLEKEINKSKKIKVRLIKVVEDGNKLVKFLKSEKAEKTYLAEVVFEKQIDKNKLKLIDGLKNSVIYQKTPTRVLKRRSDRIRKKYVREIKWKLKNSKTLILKIRASSGLYVKELITGDEGRTKPSISEILNNKPIKVLLDVIKIHSDWKRMIGGR
ncbi:MAG: tRNA pseudouridine(54/55) synthase Pus10 [Candidatus Aenigmarchaeota archaeon]|nr:tRNA pseudouridine(54/55) synthase Pus10 [Candidatus Aenigmarchaeota archaeon]